MKATEVLYYLLHVGELRSIVQWKLWHHPVHERDESKESPSLKICFDFLNKTSRSFSTVIQELHSELLVPIALFYLVLRGLDTVEDDMTIALLQKEPLLRHFHTYLSKSGWQYNGCGPEEKDRELLVQFDTVVEELQKLKPAYFEIIRDIAEKMGNGMADYCKNAEHNVNGVNTIQDYDLYCHYVAGLVGNGLTRMFVESGLANPVLLEREYLQESMGLFLQKVNIIRDVKEDLDDKRRFWPKEIWSKHVEHFEDLCKPENLPAALNCSSEMVLNALGHADQCLFYLAGLKEQSVFNFAAIPQAMAIATLNVVFRNPAVFRQNVKITKGEACRIMTKSTTNLRQVCAIFKDYTRRIHQKNDPADPNFMKISIACGRIEQFIESIFPSQRPGVAIAATDSQATNAAISRVEQAAESAEAKEERFYMLVAVLVTMATITILMLGTAWLFGARFDLAFQEVLKGNLFGEDAAQAVASARARLAKEEL